MSRTMPATDLDRHPAPAQPVADAEDTALWARMWGLPVDRRGDLLVVPLGSPVLRLDDIGLCAWDLPDVVGRGALRMIESGGSRPAVFQSAPSRLTIIGAITGRLPERTRRELAAADVVYQVDGEVPLPAPASCCWVSYPLPGSRPPGTMNVGSAVIASAVVHGRIRSY